jgi:hypothetical protein
MTTIANSPIEAYETQRLAVAKREGFALFAVRNTDLTPGFVYTVGMTQHGLPELLCFFEPELANGTTVFMTQVARRLIEGTKRFDRHALLASFIRTGITVSDPEIHYSPEFLKGDDFLYALKAYVTRGTRFREELGMPRGVLVLNHEGVPTLQQQRAELMLVSS